MDRNKYGIETSKCHKTVNKLNELIDSITLTFDTSIAFYICSTDIKSIKSINIKYINIELNYDDITLLIETNNIIVTDKIEVKLPSFINNHVYVDVIYNYKTDNMYYIKGSFTERHRPIPKHLTYNYFSKTIEKSGILKNVYSKSPNLKITCHNMNFEFIPEQIGTYYKYDMDEGCNLFKLR